MIAATAAVIATVTGFPFLLLLPLLPLHFLAIQGHLEEEVMVGGVVSEAGDAVVIGEAEVKTTETLAQTIQGLTPLQLNCQITLTIRVK